MDPTTSKLLLAAAGGAADADPVYVDDVFSTFLYEGNGNYSPKSGVNTITNGIDLSGEGGLVWAKSRFGSSSFNHALFDTERGVSNSLSVDSAGASYTYTGYGVTAFNNNGFKLEGNLFGENQNGASAVSWTFRNAPGFFNAVKYTSNSNTSVTIPHGLGSVPGMVWIKNTSRSSDWMVWHRSLGSNGIRLNSVDGGFSNANIEYSAPDATNFYAKNPGYDGNAVTASGNSDEYIAYFFAHDDASFGADGTESVVKCGSFTTNGSYYGTVTLGWEPQWVMVKNANATGGWFIHDTMRGAPVDGNSKWIYANAASAENSSSVAIRPNATGFISFNHSGNKEMIYIAIRRPNKPPTVGTEVFNLKLRTGNQVDNTVTGIGFALDSGIIVSRDDTNNWKTWYDRLRGDENYLRTDSNNYEAGVNSGVGFEFNSLTGTAFLDHNNRINRSSKLYVDYLLKRAPGFYDVVAYTGTGSTTTFNHNLTVEPELLIVKCRSHDEHWAVYSSALGPTKYLRLNLSDAPNTATIFWNDTAPTSSVFTVYPYDGVNGIGKTYVAYLFASSPGVSKVGSYDGSSSAINIDCGFGTSGARFVLIKRIDGIGDWCFFDTLRGINNGADPKTSFNGEGSEDDGNDLIDPYPSGFSVVGGNTSVNNQNAGAKYLFLAIA